eukprot:31058-Pelagococcus_subviridis.AAC.4
MYGTYAAMGWMSSMYRSPVRPSRLSRSYAKSPQCTRRSGRASATSASAPSTPCTSARTRSNTPVESECPTSHTAIIRSGGPARICSGERLWKNQNRSLHARDTGSPTRYAIFSPGRSSRSVA